MVAPGAVLGGLVGCQGHLSALAPAAAPAQAVSGLWWAMLAGSGVLFALVLALFVWAARPSERPRSAHGRRWIFCAVLVTVSSALLAFCCVLEIEMSSDSCSGRFSSFSDVIRDIFLFIAFT